MSALPSSCQSNPPGADSTCSVTMIRRRRDEWIDAGVFTTCEWLCLGHRPRARTWKTSQSAGASPLPCGAESCGPRQTEHETLPPRRPHRRPQGLRGRSGQPPRLCVAGAHAGCSPVRQRLVALDVRDPGPARCASSGGGAARAAVRVIAPLMGPWSRNLRTTVTRSCARYPSPRQRERLRAPTRCRWTTTTLLAGANRDPASFDAIALSET
jgi:hypothetical protein